MEAYRRKMMIAGVAALAEAPSDEESPPQAGDDGIPARPGATSERDAGKPAG